MDFITALDAGGNTQKLAALIVDTDKKSSIVTVNNQLDQPVTEAQLSTALAVTDTLATEATLASIVAQVGEIQPIPTANTVLDRLKAILSALVAGVKTPATSLSVTQSYAATSTLSNVTSIATSVTLLAANNNRKTAIIYNDSTAILYVCCNASAASTTNYTVKLQPDATLIIKGDDYSGEIKGVWTSANGAARVTEVV
jgi:hypothetical protein